jgi:hypothetical protein
MYLSRPTPLPPNDDTKGIAIMRQYSEIESCFVPYTDESS